MGVPGATSLGKAVQLQCAACVADFENSLGTLFIYLLKTYPAFYYVGLTIYIYIYIQCTNFKT